MSKNKKIDKEKIESLKKDLEELSKQSSVENEEILNRNLYKQTLVKNFRNIIVINTLLVIVLLIFLYFYTGENVLKYDSEYFEGFYLVFLMIVFDFGLSFIISSFSNKIGNLYKKKSLNIGIKIIILVLCLIAFSFFKNYSSNKNEEIQIPINGVEVLEFDSNYKNKD